MIDPSEEIGEGPQSLKDAMADPNPVDPAQAQYAREELRSEQSLPLGILAGAVASLMGAALWAIVTATTHFQIGWMAVGVGFLVGLAVRRYGKGFDTVFGIVGAVLSLAGCALGNLLAVCAMVAAQNKMSFFDVLSRLDPALVGTVMAAAFSPMDLLFYGIAVYEGYKLSFRRLTRGDLARMGSGQ